MRFWLAFVLVAVLGIFIGNVIFTALNILVAFVLAILISIPLALLLYFLGEWRPTNE